mmetsp:Transcript_14455/g.44273  ORF Transcript_14455/g.44273 Transcript_14455/m.44273 type:complete len:93 (-) Transcript_14455:325-603(-)|eukprot:scaffold194338_cov28-Tisochrysis_lutea.AAC.2
MRHFLVYTELKASDAPNTRTVSYPGLPRRRRAACKLNSSLLNASKPRPQNNNARGHARTSESTPFKASPRALSHVLGCALKAKMAQHILTGS